MVSFLKQTVSVKPAIIACLTNPKSAHALVTVGTLAGMLSLSACQTVPNASTAVTPVPAQTPPTQSTSSSQTPTAAVTQAPIIEAEDAHYPIEPYHPPNNSAPTNPSTQETPVFTPPTPVLTPPDTVITTPSYEDHTPSRDDYIIAEPSVPSHNELLEHARRNSQQRSQAAAKNNSDLPAFRNLMQAGISQLKSGKLTNAENSFTRAQRLAPKSSAVYFYLAQVALKKNQPRKAEAMARRGLSVSQNTSRRRALWQVILQSGQAQGNSRVINEAKRALR